MDLNNEGKGIGQLPASYFSQKHKGSVQHEKKTRFRGQINDELTNDERWHIMKQEGTPTFSSVGIQGPAGHDDNKFSSDYTLMTAVTPNTLQSRPRNVSSLDRSK